MHPQGEVSLSLFFLPLDTCLIAFLSPFHHLEICSWGGCLSNTNAAVNKGK